MTHLILFLFSGPVNGNDPLSSGISKNDVIIRLAKDPLHSIAIVINAKSRWGRFDIEHVRPIWQEVSNYFHEIDSLCADPIDDTQKQTLGQLIAKKGTLLEHVQPRDQFYAEFVEYMMDNSTMLYRAHCNHERSIKTTRDVIKLYEKQGPTAPKGAKRIPPNESSGPESRSPEPAPKKSKRSTNSAAAVTRRGNSSYRGTRSRPGPGAAGPSTNIRAQTPLRSRSSAPRAASEIVDIVKDIGNWGDFP